MKLFVHILLGWSLLVPLADGQAINDRSSDPALNSALASHIEFLSDDLLRGRDAGSPEYEIAAHYVASHFKQFGLKHAGENGSWFQSVPLTKSTLDLSSPRMILHSDNQQTIFSFPDQFTSLASVLSPKDNVRGQLAFVGYGIVSRQLNINDYANLDVKGKIVVILHGRPASFASEQGAHFGDIRVKLNQAASQGAIGVIILDTPVSEQLNSYQHMVSLAQGSLFNWQHQDGSVFEAYPGIQGIAYVTTETGKQIFTAAGLDLAKIFNQIEDNSLPASVDLNVEITLRRKSHHQTLESSNVVGLLEGSDPVLKNEYVVYSAHLDHIGVTADGLINNGALDSAAGIAIMLETARRFSLSKRPKRSILFIAVTAEEKGLLGSSYFANNPTVPAGSMVANINLDMPLILYPFADVIAFGAEHSTMAHNVETAAAAQGISVSPDPFPERALFTRSDHYSFVKQGVPSVYLMPGIRSKDPEINPAQVYSQYAKEHYHQPTDDISLQINYDAGTIFTKVNYTIGEQIANSKKRPRWNKGDFFGEIFKQAESNIQPQLASGTGQP